MEDDNKNTQIQVPAFTVLKNGSILKNIFLLRKQNPSSNQELDEKIILLVGRHPRCNITLEHPSISRYHLRIHSNPSSQIISVVDLSSVHGTWVSGKRIEPGVHVGLKEGDTVKMGSSSRVYELHWVPLSQAYDIDGQFLSKIYTIKEGEEEMNQNEKLETQSSDDDLECLDLSLPNKIHDSPLKTLSRMTSLDPEYFNSSCDDIELDQSNSSKTNNENGEISSTILVQSPLAVSGAIFAIQNSDSLNESEDRLNWLGDNLSNEFEMQNHGIVKEDPVSVSNCSNSSCDVTEVEHPSSAKTSNENGIIFSNVSVQAPAPCVVSSTISATDISDGLKKLEDQLNWLKDNLSNEFDLQSHGIIREDPFSVPNCSIFTCADTEVEHWIPWKIGNENGENFTTVSIQAPLDSETASVREILVQAPLNSEDWLKDNLSNEFAQLSPEDMKDDRVSVDLFYGIKMHEKDALNQDISDNPDRSNWLRDNLSNDFEQFSHETMKYDLVSVDLFNGIKSHEKDGISRDISNCLNKSEDGSNWLRDNLSNEFEQFAHGAMQDDPVSLNLFYAIKMREKEALNQDMSRSDENEPLDQQEFNDSLPVAVFEAETRDEDEYFIPDRSGDNEINVGCEFELMTQTKMTDESASVVLFEGVDSKVDDDVLYKPIISGEEEVDLGVKFESINQEIMKEESVFVVLSNEADMNQEQTFTPDISRAKEVHMNLKAKKNMSFSMNLFDSLDGNELELFTPDKENKNPNACSRRSLKKTWKEDQNCCTMSTEAVSPTVNEENDIFGFSKILSTSVDEVNPFVYCEEVLLSSSEEDSQSSQTKMEGSCSSIICPQTVEKGGEKKRWTMIVDTNTLLHDESLKHLKILEGLKGTRVLVPKIVIRELMNIKSQDNFLKRRAKKVLLALKWIDECMANTKWWIHMEDEIVNSSKAESQVLETAIFLRKETTDGKIVIISNDLTLKIKAMAEGIMCEAAEEFRRSLVNPFSERFMWVGSSAIGLTWSSVDNDAVRRQKYESHELKGLKLLAYV